MDESQHECVVYSLRFLTEAEAHASIYHSHWLCSTNINGDTNDLEKDEPPLEIYALTESLLQENKQ